MSNLDATRIKVQQILAENLNGVEIGKAGLSFRNGSTRTFINCTARGDGEQTFVRIQVPLLMGVRPTAELFEYLAFHAADYMFGTLYLTPVEDDGTSMLMFEHTLLGDYLDEQELMAAVAGLAGTGDDIDEELKARFGGTRFHEN